MAGVGRRESRQIRSRQAFDLRHLLPRVCHPTATRRIDAQENKAMESQMNATLERAASGANENRPRPNKIGIRIVTTGLGEGFEIVFAGCVLLGALWLLAFGYA
jgi:hypothetical protein